MLIKKATRWENFYMVIGPTRVMKVPRTITATKLKESFKVYRDIPIEVFEEVLVLMAKEPVVKLTISKTDSFSTLGLIKVGKYVYKNKFKDVCAEFWI